MDNAVSLIRAKLAVSLELAKVKDDPARVAEVFREISDICNDHRFTIQALEGMRHELPPPDLSKN